MEQQVIFILIRFWINIHSDVRLHSSPKRKNLNNPILWLQWQKDYE